MSRVPDFGLVSYHKTGTFVATQLLGYNEAGFQCVLKEGDWGDWGGVVRGGGGEGGGAEGVVVRGGGGWSGLPQSQGSHEALRLIPTVYLFYRSFV